MGHIFKKKLDFWNSLFTFSKNWEADAPSTSFGCYGTELTVSYLSFITSPLLLLHAIIISSNYCLCDCRPSFRKYWKNKLLTISILKTTHLFCAIGNFVLVKIFFKTKITAALQQML